jgi:hypothetical protein
VNHKVSELKALTSDDDSRTAPVVLLYYPKTEGKKFKATLAEMPHLYLYKDNMDGKSSESLSVPEVLTGQTKKYSAWLARKKPDFENQMFGWWIAMTYKHLLAKGKGQGVNQATRKDASVELNTVKLFDKTIGGKHKGSALVNPMTSEAAIAASSNELMGKLKGSTKQKPLGTSYGKSGFWINAFDNYLFAGSVIWTDFAGDSRLASVVPKIVEINKHLLMSSGGVMGLWDPNIVAPHESNFWFCPYVKFKADTKKDCKGVGT